MQTALSMLDRSTFEKLFNERNHNPPSPEADFDEEFDEVLCLIEPILLKHAPEEDFLLWQYHNRARFIDVAFSSEAYLQPALIRDIQQSLRTLPEDWMVSIWEACYLFVRQNEIQYYAPIPDDPMLVEFLKNCVESS